MTGLTLKEVVTDPDFLMGVKAVWGRSDEAVMCFGSRGNTELKDKGHFSQARRTAENAQTRPYFITIGGGEQVSDELRGRTLELVRGTGVYGETSAFVHDKALRDRLMQWPVAIIVSEVYRIVGEPRLVEELGFPDRRILANAYDAVIRDDEHVAHLWDALKDWEIERRWEISPPPGFRDPGKVQMFGTMYPRLDATSQEGKRVWKLSRDAERNPALKKAAKNRNRQLNGGLLTCEACGFADKQDAMFDAHHLQPLAAGVRDSRPDDLAVLCPTCHRWAHAKVEDKLSPLSIPDVQRGRVT